MKKKLLSLFVVLLCLACGISLLAACETNEEYPQWDLSHSGTKITASFSDNGNYGYVLTVEGSGKLLGFASAKNTPWYDKSGRITKIVISEGITYIGDNAFGECAVRSVVVPSTVTELGKNVFPAETRIYAYSQVTSSAYVHSQTKPTTQGKYWHYVGGIPTEWTDVDAAPLKILFIGNSYTYYNTMPEEIFAPIAASVGINAEVSSITEGSCRLYMWADPALPQGARVEAALTAASDYDIIVLQERSVSPMSEYDKFLSGAKALAKRIAETQTNCKVYLYQTWGNPASQGNYGGSIPEMESRLRTAYETVGAEIGATVSYVGKAFTYVYENYNLATLGKDSPYWLYQDDNTHPLYVGSYLAACVHAATMFGVNPKTVTFNGSLDAATAALMREVAYNTVFGS